MKIDEALINKIDSIVFLNNVGTPYKDYIQLDSLKQVSKSIESIKWENICLEERGSITEFLFKEQPQEYKYWNGLVDQINELIIPSVNTKLDILLRKRIINKNIKEAIEFDIINICVLKMYNKYKCSHFYEELLDIYIHGHMPCGWQGKYPLGKICVY